MLNSSNSIFGYEWFTIPSSRELIAEGIFYGLVYIDYRQTINFRKNGIREVNTFLGEKPSEEKIREGVLLGVIIHSIVLWIIPPEFRNTFLTSSISIESYTVYYNTRLENKYRLKIETKF